MQHFDFSPLFRSTVGFDRLTDLLNSSLRADGQAQGFPPYNIERLEDEQYRITMAVAGFDEDDISIVAQENSLTVLGKPASESDKHEYLYRGIAGRAFERRFQLADHIRVSGASLKNGLLHIQLVREVPEAMKPRQIKIAAEAKPKAVDRAA